MTLNVIVQNMVAVDSELSMYGQRTSDDFEKSESFTHKNYQGILIGNGSAFILLDAISFVRHQVQPDLVKLMGDLEQYLRSREDKRYQDYLAIVEEKIKTKWRMVPNPSQRDEMIAKEFSEEVEKLHKQIHESHEHHSGRLYLVGYDKLDGKLRKYILENRKGATAMEYDLTHVLTDGSGGDLAGAYLSTQTSGLDWNKITPQFNFYLTALACAAATANAGVGGFMQVALVTTEKVEYLGQEKVNAAVRVCSKQIAGELSKKEAIRHVTDIYNNGISDFKAFAAMLDLTENDLLYSPCRLHQDVSKFNKMLGIKQQ